MTKKRFSSQLILKIGACLLVLAIAYVLKDYYSRADSDSLFWVLAPTAFVAEKLSGITFVREVGSGWANLDYKAVIAPACAGVNFMIIAFCMSAFQGIRRSGTLFTTLLWIGAAGFSAYCLTIVTNALRICLSIKLYHLDIYSAWLTPDSLHRVAGVGIYYLFLCFYYLAVSFILSDNRLGKTSKNGVDKSFGLALLCVPLVWYLLFALGVPYVNNAFMIQPERFLEHATTVGATSVGITLFLLSIFAGSRCLLKKRSNYSAQWTCSVHGKGIWRPNGDS